MVWREAGFLSERQEHRTHSKTQGLGFLHVDIFSVYLNDKKLTSQHE